MAQQPVAELWIQHQRGAIVVQVPTTAVVQQTYVSSRPNHDKQQLLVMIAAGAFGLMLLGAGLPVSAVFPLFALGIAIGLMVRRSQKQQLALPAAATPALPPTPPEVQSERGRRALQALVALGEPTFEVLLAKLRWTEPVLVETLVVLKQQGLVEEDLNLDSGQWVYRAQSPEHFTGGAFTLDERKQRVGAKNG